MVKWFFAASLISESRMPNRPAADFFMGHHKGSGIMSGSRVYEFHQQEVDDLKAAAIYSLSVCDNLQRLLAGIREDKRHWAARSIAKFLSPSEQCKAHVDKVDHLIAPVGVPVKVPIRTKVHNKPDGIHYEKKFPLSIELREERIAHHAVWVVHDTVARYLWSVWRRGNPKLIYTHALEATDELVVRRWHEIREELRAFVDYDCEGLRQAIEAESNAAIARCRQTIVGDASSMFGSVTNSEISSDDTGGTQVAISCEEELLTALRTRGIRQEVAATLTAEQKRNIIMVHWGNTPAKARDRWQESKWQPFLGKESKTKLADKVKTYIKRGKKKLDELAGGK